MRESRDGSRVSRTRWVALAAAAAGLACGAADSGEREHREGEQPSRTGAGSTAVVRVENPTPAWDGPRRLELVREVPGRMGGDGPDEERGGELAAADVRDLSPAPGGRLLVLDGEGSRAVVLDGDGRVVLRVGRPGPGPGELRSPGRVEPGRAGGVVVLERRPPTVHRWDSAGGFLGRRRLRSADGRESARGIAEWGDRLAAGRAVRMVLLDPADPSRSRSSVYVADSTGLGPGPVVSWRRDGTHGRLPEVFGARRSWAAVTAGDGSGRIAVARGDRYEIRRYDLSGRLRAVVRREVDRIPVSDRMRRRALDRFVGEARRGGAPEGMAARLRGRVPVADRLPAIGEIWPSSTDGRLWVGVPGEGEPGGPASTVRAYDVFDPELAYLGRVSAPRGFRLHRVRGDLLYGSYVDELGVPGVRVYRLRAPRDP